MFDKEKFYKEASEGFKKKKEKVGKTNSERRREMRTQRRAERRASKGDAKKGSDQFKANVEAEKNLIKERRGKRQEFLRSFAANLAGDVQSSQGGTFKTKDIDAFGQKPGDEFNPNISDSEKANKMETEQNEEQFKSMLDGVASKDNSDLGNIGFQSTSQA